MDDGIHPAQPILLQLVSESLTELLEHYGQRAVEPLTKDQHYPRALAGSVAFLGPELRGSITLLASEAAISSALPAAEAPTFAAVADWTGELTNQLMGRLKRKLSAYGTSVDIGVPSVFRGDRLALLKRSNACQPAWQLVQVTSLQRTFQVRLDVDVRDDLQLSVHTPSAALPAEGEALLF